MNRSFILSLLITVTLTFFLFILWQYYQLSQHDPYSWANPGDETLESRDLWMHRRSMFIWSGVISFAIACILGVILFLHTRKQNKQQE